VNGEDILYTEYARVLQEREQQQSQQTGRALTLDERRRLEEQVFDEIVNDRLLRQELERRRIAATDAEVIQAAQTQPPPELLQNPELQTEGRFDPEKYRRFLSNPAARQQGVLQYLESYYRTQIPRQKLFAQVASDVYVPDARLWQMWQDERDSAQIAFVALRADVIADSGVRVSEDEVRSYYDKNAKSFERPGRAVVSLLAIPRAVSAADTLAARERALALRAEIAGGAKFEDGRPPRERRLRLRRAWWGARRGGTRPIRAGVRAGGVCAAARRALPARADELRLPRDPRRRAPGRHALAASHPRADRAERLDGHAHRPARRLAGDGGRFD
jgi:peptidyl-prolyl cis-trans isomerase D